MTPTNSSFNKDSCISTSSNCVVWEGPDLTCIDLCNGDSISDVTYKLATKLCEFIDTFDFTDVDLKCIFTACLGCPAPDKTLKGILTLLINKTCALEDLIEAIDTSPTVVFPVLEVNLKCLAITDGSGNVLNDGSNEAIVQAIIDQVCLNKTNISLINSEITDLDDRVTVLENATTDIPSVSSDCTFVGNLPIDQAFETLDGDYCEYKTIVGQPSEISTAIGRQCSLPALVGNPALILSPTNLAESFNNLWLAYCNLLTRVTQIENTCCAPTCDAIKIGFRVVFGNDKTATLIFDAGAGTTVPSGWADCGSKLTVSDTLGNSITVSLTITNNYTSPAIDLTGFSTGTNLTFTVDSKFCNDTLTCQKCTPKTVKYDGGDCCSICNGGTDDITVVYKVLLNSGN